MAWRDVTCPGCPVACRYRDFKPFAGGGGFAETRESLFVANDDPATWKHKRRSTILGIMHEVKLEAWNEWTNKCPRWGTDGKPESEGSNPFGSLIPF